MISELFVQQLYSVIDMAIIGRYLGARELGAVGNAANIIMLFLVVSGGFEMAVDVMVSRLLGAGKNKEKAAMARDTLFLSAISGLVLVVIAWISLPALYKAVSLPENMVGDALLYGRVYLFALPIIYIYDVGWAILISNERAKISFYLLATSSILNLLNLLFILVLQLGVLGSALGTVLAQGITMLVTLYLLAKMDRQEEEPVSPKPDLSWTKIKSILHIALPTIFQQFSITFGATLVQACVNPFGQEAILGYVAIVKVMNLARIVLVGFAQTLTLMTAQLLAAKTYSAVKAVYRYCSNVSLIYWLVSSALSVIFCQLLAGMFFDPGQNQAAYSFFRVYLYAFVGIQLFSIFKFLNEGLLRSMVLMKEYLYYNLGELALKLAATWLLLTPLQTNAFWGAELGARIICVLGSTILVIKEIQALEAIEKAG
ncbi:MATE family efflux transporter [Lactobacillus delbrueckii subsp. lactis]|uniref:Probable multidrug resistance protein NorM n=1 Tax=Lactobacillus leichmannii TaxID=28039 RepID=A0ABT1XZI1_LACLE|nr:MULTISPECIES: MATE family efflux transporter [Lactobacillus]APG68156.1 MATE family efflux transporter [Lactobacillus delbrueckii subsp. lactis]MCD5490689.1 MATE family efflux transporter [Lactobacillus delbrueckii subsp. lactis]MCD5496118.1 MATE family efflux transporter [Lactobacillus delbrueckii subsp. lactis]MCD5497739.1 MATE family efflux transporter [Lactobacillus delbrueckii subsp. lactis]MCD5499660.1 MATE family efflux transporter [Lactobacillus delbrueckii subsp. lactis]